MPFINISQDDLSCGARVSDFLPRTKFWVLAGIQNVFIPTKRLFCNTASLINADAVRGREK